MDSTSHLFALHRAALLDPTAFAELPEVALSPAGGQVVAVFQHPPAQREQRGRVPKTVLQG